MTVLAVGVVLGGMMSPLAAGEAQRPNILWLTCEDAGPYLGSYGDPNADTPNLDRFAEQSLRYLNAWSTAPVCAPARTTIISGLYAPSLGAQHMRSRSRLPEGFSGFPVYLREKGYFCTNNSKEDYNLNDMEGTWDESSRAAHWKNRAEGQPFFSVFNFTVSHESQIRNKADAPTHDVSKMVLPPYHPDTPEVRKDWAQDYDNITTMDGLFGEKLAELEEAGLADDTIVFFYSDHGSGMPRHKRWTYQSGLHVPMIVHVPERFRHLAPADYVAGGTTERLVGFVDLAPTVLSLSGVLPPDYFQGHAFMGAYEAPPQPYAYGFRDRMDERIDMTRAVRDVRYLYVRNYQPHRAYGQYLNYMFQTPTTAVWKAMYDRGELNAVQSAFWEEKPAEELYDIDKDPYQVHNLAGQSEFREVQRRLRKAQQDHARRVRDLGFLPELEIHSRSVGTSPYEMARDASKYRMLEIMAAAEVSANRDAAPELSDLLKAEDSAIRYWGATGVLIRGESAVDAHRAELRRALEDTSPPVRVVAAEALGRFGEGNDVDLALATLLDLADMSRQEIYVAVAALNALDYLDERALPQLDAIRALPQTLEGLPRQLSSYVPRLVEKTLADLEP